jgi:hypothetical protein
MSQSQEPGDFRVWHVAAALESMRPSPLLRVNLPPGLHGQMVS